MEKQEEKEYNIPEDVFCNGEWVIGGSNKANCVYGDCISGYIKELHDNWHPEVLFFTQTSSIISAIIYKSAWKKAWPEEKQPLFLTIDVHSLRNQIQSLYGSSNFSEKKPNEKNSLESKLENLDSSELSNIFRDLEKKFEKYKIGGNVAILDETGYCARYFNGKRRLTFEYNEYLNDPNFERDYIDIERPFTLKTAAFCLNKIKEKCSKNSSLIMMTSGTEGLFGNYPKPFLRNDEKVDGNEHYTCAKGNDRKRFLGKLELYKSTGERFGEEIRILNGDYSNSEKKLKQEGTNYGN
ncbi:MAG: hypothetical protein ACOYT4_03840 [Nanoarchaeota archaeon]